MTKDAGEKMECVAEQEADMLKSLIGVASGELQICGIEHQHGDYNKK
jgi:hypothetical protein